MAARRVNALTDYVLFCLLFLVLDHAFGQDRSNYGGVYESRNGALPPQNSGGYQTYIYKDRRYGYQQPYLDPDHNRGKIYSPQDRYRVDVSFRFYIFFFVRFHLQFPVS